MLADALEHLVRGIVDSPDDVDVRVKSGRRSESYLSSAALVSPAAAVAPVRLP